eukprot:639883-Alexandrium_andersonii.AAC.1
MPRQMQQATVRHELLAAQGLARQATAHCASGAAIQKPHTCTHTHAQKYPPRATRHTYANTRSPRRGRLLKSADA